MKILVTGFAGFIGYHVTRELLKNHHEVVGLDNFSTGRMENVIDLLDEFGDQVEVNEGSINDKKLIMSLMRDCDSVIHLAATPKISRSIKDPKGTAITNIVGTINMLECAAKSGIKKFIFASSSSIYGDSVRSLNENSFQYPNNPYGLQKWSAEQFCKYYNEKFGLKVGILRYFNVYGERQFPDSGAVIPSFIYGIMKNDSVQINGGLQTRSYIYVGDVAYATRLAVEDLDNDLMVMNIAGLRAYTVNEIFNKITLEIGRPSEVFYLPMVKTDRINSMADIDEAKRILGFMPFETIGRGIQNTINWIRKELITEEK